jgi:3'-phosphoadenosine 5'-phosphosulfate sulfotransferase (PAPS reductase)/FAD synthetase
MSKRHIASVSWGKDSLCMLLMLIEKELPLDEVVFYDTGMEFQSIYDTRDAVLPMLAEYGIKYKELHPANPMLWDMFERPVNEGKQNQHLGYSWCGGVCRWGTTAKNKALDNYCGDNIVYVGIAHDEPKRYIDKEVATNKQHPLVDWKVPEEQALVYCYQKGFWWYEDGVPLYSILDRVSCWCCANKNLKELRGYYNYLPKYWERLRELQGRTERPMKGKGKSVFELEERFRKEATP